MPPKKQVKKPRQIRFYAIDGAEEILDEIGNRTPELSETEIVRIHLLKALKATKANGYRMSFPFEFRIVSEAALNEKNR